MENQLKYLRNLFYDLFNDYGRVYVVLKYSEHARIGRRGFTEEEKEKGLVLVFTQNNNRDLQWTEDGNITTTLGFGAGNKPEKCFFGADDIISVFSPDAKVRFDRWDWLGEDESPKAEAAAGEDAIPHDDKVVPLDKFRKPKR
ncbi:MAG: hypothetical protein ACOYVJ_09770 [Nitrospirota bacterium]